MYLYTMIITMCILWHVFIHTLSDTTQRYHTLVSIIYSYMTVYIYADYMVRSMTPLMKTPIKKIKQKIKFLKNISKI